MNCNTTHYRANSSSVPGDPTQEACLGPGADKWDDAVYAPLAGGGPNGRHRQLRVGFVGGFSSPITRFITQQLRLRDQQRVFYAIYANDHQEEKEVPALLDTRALCDLYRNVADVADPRTLAALIKDDCIDVLVDLCGHAHGNRLDVFALRAAPVQCTWIGYPNTTGLPTVQYRITDARVDPLGTTQQHAERLVRMPDDMPFLCYDPQHHLTASAVEDAPALRNGYITFGVFNSLVKAHQESLRCWADVLFQVPGSRLVFKHMTTRRENVRERVRSMFERMGVARERIEILPPCDAQAEHMAAYARIDIALDTFPYSGTSTTFDALHAGVPVVTLAPAYDNHCHRVTASLLERLPAELLARYPLIAKTRAEYVSLAARLANLPRAELNALRHALQPALLASPLCNGPRAARAFEQLATGLFEDWRATQAQAQAQAQAEPAKAPTRKRRRGDLYKLQTNGNRIKRKRLLNMPRTRHEMWKMRLRGKSKSNNLA